jgi:hypothetical protein
MKDLLARRPSPALVIAVIALICALTGTAWAALGVNSVGSKQLKSNAVTTAKIKKEAVTAKKIKKLSITGKQINLKKLGTVPSAQLANTIPAPEATHLVGAPGEPPFENGSQNVGVVEGTKFNSVGFFKDQEGLVHLEGVAKIGTSSAIVVSVFTLPPGFRPPQGTILVVPHSGIEAENPSASAIIGGTNTLISGLDLSGKVVGSEGKIMSLDGYTYRPGS